MTDTHQDNETTIHDNKMNNFGLKLRAAREAQQISREEVAARLRLNPELIHQLETENFDKTPPTTFTRGYLRSYARLLNLDERDIAAALNTEKLALQQRTLIAAVQHTGVPMQESRYIHWFTGLIVLALIILMGFWWSTRPHAVPTQLQHETMKQPITQITQTPSASTITQPPVEIKNATTAANTQTAVSPVPSSAASIPAAATPPAPTTTAPVMAQSPTAVTPAVPVTLPPETELQQITATPPAKPAPRLPTTFSQPTEPGLEAD